MKKVLIVSTGGTILMSRDNVNSKTYKTVKNPQKIINAIPNLGTLADISFSELFNIDSANMSYLEWAKIAETIFLNYKEYDGFVILHGTDTMAYTASALSFALGNLGKPVILTGSQVPLSEIGSDGYNNVINAVRFAISDLGEVAIFFGSRLIRGNKSTKISEFDLHSFETVNSPYVGKVGLEVKLKPERICRNDKSKLNLCAKFDDRVLVLKVFPGIRADYLEGLLAKDIKGIVIEGFGAGNLPNQNKEFMSFLNKLLKKGIIVVISTQCLYGTAEFERYVGGLKAKSKGALTSFDMSKETTIVKLMWVLANAKNKSEVRKLYYQNIAKEINHRYLF